MLVPAKRLTVAVGLVVDVVPVVVGDVGQATHREVLGQGRVGHTVDQVNVLGLHGVGVLLNTVRGAQVDREVHVPGRGVQVAGHRRGMISPHQQGTGKGGQVQGVIRGRVVGGEAPHGGTAQFDGFVEVGRRPGYYEQGAEDAIVMEFVARPPAGSL